MPAIMADHDVEGHVHVLLRLLLSDEWYPMWTALGYTVVSFESLGLPTTTPDVELWQLCQARQIVLITGNRNKDGPRSLEATIQQFSVTSSLPVLTIGEPNRILTSPEYADRVVERLLEYLVDVENLRGTGRLYLP
jgi:hypothetical protein